MDKITQQVIVPSHSLPLFQRDMITNNYPYNTTPNTASTILQVSTLDTTTTINESGVAKGSGENNLDLPSASSFSEGTTSDHVQTMTSEVTNGSSLIFLFKKKLQKSDVNNLKRIVIPKKSAEGHLPWLHEKEGIFLSMDDMDRTQSWKFRYRFWPNNKSRMYVLENTGDFAKKYCLQSGDYVLLYRDRKSFNYVIEGRRQDPRKVVNEAKPCPQNSRSSAANSETGDLGNLEFEDDDPVDIAFRADFIHAAVNEAQYMDTDILRTENSDNAADQKPVLTDQSTKDANDQQQQLINGVQANNEVPNYFLEFPLYLDRSLIYGKPTFSNDLPLEFWD